MIQQLQSRFLVRLAARALAVFILLAAGPVSRAQDLDDEPLDDITSGAEPDAEPEPRPESEFDDSERRSSSRSNWDEPGEAEADSAGAARESGESGQSDHARMVGHAGIGFFGVVSLPMAGAVQDPETGVYLPDYSGSLAAPTIGMRYWASELVGVEFGVGIGISTGVFEQEVSGATVVNDPPAYGGGVVHVGLPLAVGHSGHFVLEIIPEIDVGFGAGTIFGSVASADINLRGFLIQAGARAGGEIHFGFIDVPQLSLQGTIGFHLRSEHRASDGPGNDSTTSTNLTAGTSVEQNPWDFFTTNVSAIYYFP